MHAQVPQFSLLFERLTNLSDILSTVDHCYSPIECLFVTFYITCSIFTIASNFCNYVYIATYLLTCLYNSLYTYKEHREVGVGHDSAPLCRPRFTAMNRKWPRPRVWTHLPIGRGREPRLPATQQTCGRVDRLAVHRGYP